MEFAASAFDLGQDVGGSGRPDKRRRARIVACEVSADRFDQFGQAAKDPSTQTLGAQVPKEALHHVEPRGACRREVQMKARMLFQPGLDLGMFVRGVVIQDQVQVAIRRRLLIEQAQELQPFDMAVAPLALAGPMTRMKLGLPCEPTG